MRGGTWVGRLFSHGMWLPPGCLNILLTFYEQMPGQARALVAGCRYGLVTVTQGGGRYGRK